jgi:3-oxoacyl-[acyl-carrier protein] reductase
MDLGLADKTVLITGSYRGTGAGTARVFAGEGAKVLVHGFETGQGEDLVAELSAAGGAAALVTGDVMTDEGADAVRAQAEAAFGTVDVLVNNYGAPGRTSWDTPAAEWNDGWERNVLSAVRMTQQFVPAMRARGWGRVVFLGTIGTERPGKRNPDYYGAKAAVPALVRSLAQELRGTGVTANLVSPGMIATDEVKAGVVAGFERATGNTGSSWADAERWALDTRMPNLTERIPAPEDIGRFVMFVASEAAWHLQGADLKVDGGAIDA